MCIQEVQICVSIMEMFAMLPASTFQLTEPLSVLCSKGEKALGLEVCVFMCVRIYIIYPRLAVHFELRSLSFYSNFHLKLLIFSSQDYQIPR